MVETAKTNTVTPSPLLGWLVLAPASSNKRWLKRSQRRAHGRPSSQVNQEHAGPPALKARPAMGDEAVNSCCCVNTCGASEALVKSGASNNPSPTSPPHTLGPATPQMIKCSILGQL